MRVRFDRALLGLEPEQVGPFWIDRRIRDESMPPRTAPTAYLALRVVAALPGAITYIERDMLVTTVRALTIDQKPAGDPGYPLR
jgi:hypothetical protein